MSIELTSPKKFLGADIPNVKVLSSKVDEIITQVNTNETNISTNTSDIATINSYETATVSPLKTVTVTLTATEIVGTSAGDIGHANGAILVAAPSSAYALEFVSAVLIFDYATAAYTGGANDMVIRVGTVAQTTAMTDTNCITANGDKVFRLGAIATEKSLPVGSTINLAGTAFTNPGTAAGVLRVKVTYRTITTGL